MIPRAHKVHYNENKPAIKRKEEVNKTDFRSLLEEEIRKREDRYSCKDKK